MKKRIIIATISALLLIGLISTAVYFNQASIAATKAKQTQQEAAKEVENKTITYQGKEGVTALALLQQAAKVETSGSGEMAFVTTINGVTANSKKEFWAFNINGIAATVGAGSYVTKNSDTIVWTLSSF